MLTYPIYKAMKLRLNGIAPIFYYMSQYQSGKDNTSYRVPAIYIETPKETALSFYGRRTQVAKDARFKIHYISDAPFKNHDNPVQDSAIAAHEEILKQIDTLITGWNLADTAGKLLTQQFLPVGASINNLVSTSIFSVIEYRTEVFSYHLRS